MVYHVLLSRHHSGTSGYLWWRFCQPSGVAGVFLGGAMMKVGWRPECWWLGRTDCRLVLLFPINHDLIQIPTSTSNPLNTTSRKSHNFTLISNARQEQTISNSVLPRFSKGQGAIWKGHFSAVNGPAKGHFSAVNGPSKGDFSAVNWRKRA